MSTTRRSFLKTLAGALVGWQAAKAGLALAKKSEPKIVRPSDFHRYDNPRLWTSMGNGVICVSDPLPLRFNAEDYHGEVTMEHIPDGPFVSDPYSMCAIAMIHELERQKPGSMLVYPKRKDK